MGFVPLEFPPGIARAGTEYQVKGRWFNSHLVRWFANILGPIAGWVARTSVAMSGKGRALITWRDNSTVRWMAIGTHLKLYGMSQTGANPSDITPVGLTTGVADATIAGGYGIGIYGAGAYGTPRSDTGSIQPASVWTLDTFGEDLLACLSEDGRIFEWGRNIAAPATALGGTAPTGNQGVVVTPERFIFALGAGGDKRKVQWADQESKTVWTPTATNQAGDFNIASQGSLLFGKRLRSLTLVWTELDVHAANYIGLPFVYSIERIGENCGGISKNCAGVVDTRAYWWSRSGFFYSDGAIAVAIPCDVYELVMNDMNITQSSKISAWTRAEFGEIWFLYPSGSSTEIDRYVIWNYLEGWWAVGLLVRLSGVDRGIYVDPIYVGDDGLIYNHELGFSYTGQSTPFVETGPMELGDGERTAKVRQLIPDEATQGQVVVTFYAKDSPNGAETTYGPFTMTEFTNTRFEARQAKMRVTGNVSSAWRWGNARLDVVPGGRRHQS